MRALLYTTTFPLGMRVCPHSPSNLDHPSDSGLCEIGHTFEIQALHPVSDRMIVWVQIMVIGPVARDADYRVSKFGPCIVIRAAILHKELECCANPSTGTYPTVGSAHVGGRNIALHHLRHVRTHRRVWITQHCDCARAVIFALRLPAHHLDIQNPTNLAAR